MTDSGQLTLLADSNGSPLFGPATCSADLSPCRRYRYDLWRKWEEAHWCMFVGLNPSTADERHDDPTIRKCVAYAKRWGFGGLCMVNLFAFRATQPRDMMAAEDPIGPKNDEVLLALSRSAGIVIAAWGKDGSYKDRARQVMALLPNLYCLKQNKDGSPAHPLYLRGDLTPYPLNDQADRPERP